MKATLLKLTIPFIASLTIFGCSREEQSAQTVSWFQQHPDERKAMVERCADDPGRLAATPNCINAQQAQSLEGIGSFRKLPPVGLDPNHKPRFEENDDRAQVRP